MRERDVRFAEVNRLLEGLGFVPDRVPGSHVRWEHPQARATILLPDNGPKEIDRWNGLIGVGAQLDLQGLLDREAFDRWLLQAGKPKAASNGAPPTKKGRRKTGNPRPTSS